MDEAISDRASERISWLGLGRPFELVSFPAVRGINPFAALAYGSGAIVGPASPSGGPASGRAQICEANKYFTSLDTYRECSPSQLPDSLPLELSSCL
ncbi:MAG: hypothetical protein AB8A43_04615 [Prochlorococcus sp.]